MLYSIFAHARRAYIPGQLWINDSLPAKIAATGSWEKLMCFEPLLSTLCTHSGLPSRYTPRSPIVA